MFKKSLLLVWAMSVSVSVQAAPEYSNRTQITGYFTGWVSNAIRIQLNGETYTEGNCPNKDGYMTSETDYGLEVFKTHSAALLAAYMAKKNVLVIIDGCNAASGRPKIIGLDVTD